MSGAYRVILPGETPLVEAFSFKNDPDFRDQWVPVLKQRAYGFYLTASGGSLRIPKARPLGQSGM